MHEAREHMARMLPAEVVKQLERLVSEVHDVTGIYVDVVGCRREDDVRNRRGRDSHIDRRA